MFVFTVNEHMHYSNSHTYFLINCSSENENKQKPKCHRSNQRHVPSLVNLSVATCGRHSSVVFNSFRQRFVRLGLAMFFAIIFTIMCNWEIQLAHSAMWTLWPLCWRMTYRVHSSVLSVKILMVHFFLYRPILCSRLFVFICFVMLMFLLHGNCCLPANTVN